MSMKYKWMCRVCEHYNQAGTDLCENCSSAAELSTIEIAERKQAIREGVDFDDRTPDQLIPLTREPSWSIEVSMGKNAIARKVGDIIFYAAIFLSLVALLISSIQLKKFDWYYLAAAGMSIGIAFDIRNFCRGRTTYMEVSWPATRTNTYIRWLGLVLDVLLLYFALTIAKT